ncbi:UNC-like C-terminal-domain-containing protein [Paraphysoderma sedebokerense]|nr:UNC-like C-terminal-domain-containing protein [Paraphysoderma sedebokerense]
MRVNDILCTIIFYVLLSSLHASKKEESCSVPPPNDFYDLFTCRLYSEGQYVIDKDPTDPIRTKIEKFITKASIIYVSTSASNQEGSTTTTLISRSILPSDLVSTPSSIDMLPDTATLSTKSSVYSDVNDRLPKSANSSDKGSINATRTSEALIESTKEASKSSLSHSSSSHAGESGIKSTTIPSIASTSAQTAKKTPISDTLDLAIPSRPSFDDSFLDWRYPDLDEQILHLEVGDNTFDSQSDSRHFPSFEEWRKNALLKEGQAAEGIYWHKKRTNKPDAESILSNLEDVGVDTADVLEGQHYNSLPEEVTGPEILVKEKPNASSASSTPISDPRDSKDRFNYASFDCAATVMAANTEAKGATAILMESKDQYMLNICSANKYVIVELCDEILVDTVALANYEFFASTFKDFRVYVSDRYPPKGDGWKLLGEFHGKNTRDLQVICFCCQRM